MGNLFTDFRETKGWRLLKKFFKHNFTPRIWYLICEIISLIIFSEYHSLAEKRENRLSFLQRRQKQAVETKMKHEQPLSRTLGSQLQSAPLARSALFWTWAPLHQPVPSPSKTGQVWFSVWKAAPILTSTHLWVSSALATEAPGCSFSIFVLHFQVTQDSVSSLRMIPWWLKKKLPSLDLS